MLDYSTIYLLGAMLGFVLVAVVLVYHHNCSEIIQKKRMQLRGLTNQLEPRIEALDKRNSELKDKINKLDDQIASMGE